MHVPARPRKPRAVHDDVLSRIPSPPPAAIASRADCLEQLLEAFRDIADRDDIHQAAERLALAQAWIRREAERAAADPIFALIRLAS